MIKSLTVTNHMGESLTLELASPEKSGLVVQSIDGLGPSKATINSSELATFDGSIFNSARATERNIVIKLLMLDAPTVEDSRQKTYRYFPVKKQIKLEIETTNRKVETSGYVESNEPDIFSNQESTQISIICHDPYFYDSGDSSVAFSGAEPLFEFPFSNESATEPLIEFSSVRLDSRAIVTYHGDADSGVLITIHATGSVKNIVLGNVGTKESMSIDTDKIESISGAPINNGDEIIISTIKGSKYAMLLRNGEYTNILGALNKDADWFQLTIGDNIFTYAADEGEENLMVTFAFNNAYGGI